MIRRVKAALLAAIRGQVRLLNRATTARFAAAMSLGAVLLASDGCGPYADPLAAESGGREECGSAAYAKLVAGYAIALNQACGSTPVAKCAEILKAPVVAEHEPKFDKWAEECE